MHPLNVDLSIDAKVDGSETDAKLLKDLTRDDEYKLEECTVWEDWERHNYKYADVVLYPGEFRKFKFE